MRIATVAAVTSAVTIAIGGMIAFCRAEDPRAFEGDEAAAVSPGDDASSNWSAVDAMPAIAPLTAADADPPAGAAEVASSSPESTSTRRWGDAEPKSVSPATAFAEELSAIRDRVGTAVPQNWEAFGAPVEPVDRSSFAQNVEELEANDPGRDSPLQDPSAADPVPGELPPALAESQAETTSGIPLKPSHFEPDWQYFPPSPEMLPYESPEALPELSKLLSATARDLERLAHIREEQRRYDEADRFRRLAMQLRRENRRMLSEPTPNPAYPGPNVGRR